MKKFYEFELQFDPYKNAEILPIAKYMEKHKSCSEQSCKFCPLSMYNYETDKTDGTICLATIISRHIYRKLSSPIYGKFVGKTSSEIRDILIKEYIVEFSKPNYEHEEMEI